MLSTKMIGNKIAEARKKVNISQTQLAEMLFISPQAVGKWERGESMPDITTFNRLAEILGVDLNYFGEASPSGQDENAASEQVVEQGAEFTAEAGKISKSEQSGKKHKWDMSRGNWVDADFSGLKDLQERFSSSNMQRCKFVGSNLSGIQLKGNNIDECDFSNSDISKSHIQRSQVVNNSFKNCALEQTEFLESHVKGCDFSGANLTEAKFEFLSFMSNMVEDAVWQHTSFLGTQIDNIVFNGNISDCYFDNCSFKKVTFQNATVINTFFKGRKLKGIRFINCQVDRMTYEFLKNGKADLTGITLLTK